MADIDWSKFAPETPTADVDWSAFQPAPDAGLLRKGLDVALELPIGANTALKAGLDAFGADNPLSKWLGDRTGDVRALQSDARQFELQSQAARTKSAEGTGIVNEVLTAGKNFLESPISTTVNAAGSVVPTALAAVAGPAVGVPGVAAAGLLGTAMGAGAAKSSIYEDLVSRGKEGGLTDEEALRVADAAQAYFGPNMDQITLGAALGTLASTTGIERIMGGAPAEVKSRVLRALKGAAQEAVPEGAQGGQEKLAANVAAQREGYEVDTWSGVAGQTTAEALAGAGPGGVVAAMQKYETAQGPVGRAAALAEAQQAVGALPSPDQLTAAAIDQEAVGQADQRAEERAVARSATEEARIAAPETPVHQGGTASVVGQADTDPVLPFTQPPYNGPVPTVGTQSLTGEAAPILEPSRVIPDPAAQLALERPTVQDQYLAAQRKRAKGELLSQAEAALLKGPDPLKDTQVSLASPVDDVGLAKRQEAIEDVALATGDNPADVQVFTSQDLPDGPAGNQQGAGLTRSAAAVIEGLGRVFGTEYRFYDAPGAADRGDGFVYRGRRDGVAYIRAVEGDAAPLVVAGHETYHTFTSAERARFSAAIEPFVDVSDVAQLTFLSDYTGGRYQQKVVQLIQAGVTPSEAIDSILAQAQQDGVANITRAQLREEFDADIFGNRMKDTGFWEKVFTELKAQDRNLLVKIRDAIKQTIAYLKSQAGKVRGFDTDRYIRDLDAVQQIAARTLLSVASRKESEQSSRQARSVVRSQARARIGPFGSAKVAEGSKAWQAQQGLEYNLEQAEDGFYLTLAGAQNEQTGRLDQGRSTRAEVDAGASRQGDQRDADQQRAARSDQPSAGQGRVTSDLESRVQRGPRGEVSLTGVHFSREPRQVLDGRFYGTGLKGAEARRLEGEPDRRLHERVYAYVNEGAGVTAESGVGSYPHEPELSNLYDLASDPLGLRIKNRGDTNALEKAILDQGFTGYYVKGAFPALKQGSAVVMGDASHAVVPKGEVVRSASRTLEKENQVAITVGGKPGEFGWSPAAKVAAAQQEPEVDPAKLAGKEVPPFAGPTQQRPNLEVLGESVRRVLAAKPARDTIEALTGARVTGVAQIAGSWEGKPEPSFVLTGEMSFEQANEASKVLGFLMAQDATVSAQPWFEEADDQIPAILISQNKVMTAEQVKALADAARAVGLDYSTSVDGRGAKFLHFGDQDGYLALRAAVDEIRKAAGLKELTDFYVRSNLNDAETYLEGGVGRLLREERDQAGSTGPSDLFRRAVDSLLVPYAKAVGAEGYRFSPERYGRRFGLTDAEVEYIRAALRPKSGKALSTVPLVTGAERLNPPRNNARTKPPSTSKNDLLWALQNRAAQIGFIEPGDYSPEAHKVIAEGLADEVIYNLGRESGKNAVGWYDAALKKAKAQYERVFPELRQDADREMLFDATLGIASQGNDVHSNAVFAGRVYHLMVREGMSLGQATETLAGTFGKQTVAIEKNYTKLEHLLNTNGYDKARAFFNTKATVGELNAVLRRDTNLYGPDGKPLKIDGAAEETVTGWMVFGPKIGSFINNLHGDYSTLTADLWFSRTWNRMLGFVFNHKADKENDQYVKLYRAMVEEVRTGKGRDLVGTSQAEADAWAADPESMLTFARQVHLQREAEYKSIRDAAVTPLRQAAKNLLQNREEATEVPRTDRERHFQQTTVEAAQKIIRRKTGVNISIADIQAVLWYHEKDLYRSFGVGDSKAEAADYADAASRFVTRYQDGDLFYVEKPKPRYIYGAKGDYLNKGGVVRSSKRAQSEELASAFLAASNFDGAFKLPRSEATTLEGIFSEVLPDLLVKNVTAMYSPPGGRQMWRVSQGGSDAFVTLDPFTENVWINVAAMGEGKGGSRIYAAVGNWAANNGYTFVGDPDGLSDAGKRRRLENLISLKLKFPLLDVRLHPSQLAWLEDKHGVTLDLSEQNSLQNLGEYLRASYEVNRQLHPEIENAVFQPDGSFSDRRTGEPFDFRRLTREARSSIFAGSAGGVGAPGDSTLRRAALAKSVVESQARNDGSSVSEALYALRDQPVPTPEGLKDLLYSAARARRAFADLTPGQEAALRDVGLLTEPKTFKQRFQELTQDLAKRLTQGIVDQYAPLKELDFRSYVLARMSKGTDGTFEAALYYGTPRVAGDTVEIDTSTGGLMTLLSTLHGEQDRFLAWIAANRAEQLSAEGREFLFTPQQIQDLKALNQGTMGDGRNRAIEYARVLKGFNAFQDSVLAIAEARGLIDGASRQVWQNGFYVPFYRNMEDGTTGPSVKSGLVNQYAFKKLKGSSRKLNEDLLANTLQNMAHLLSAASKNQAAAASLRAAQSAGVAHRVPSGTKGAVRFLDGGVEQFYLVDDPFIYDAITSLESVKVVGLEKVLSKFKHWLTMGVTINPTFQLRSLMRDAISSIAITKIGMNPLANVKQGISSQLAKDPDYINALASGGLIRFNSLLEGNRAEHTRRLIRMGVEDSSILDTQEKITSFLRKGLDKWLAVGDISESTNRMALYKQLIAKGEDPLLAAYQARDLMDFSMQGQWRAVRFLTQVVPFLNARLQGLYKLGRDGVVPTAKVLFGGGNASDKQIAKRFGAVTGAVAMASIALMAAYADDEDWKKREDWDRDTYWWFKVGGVAYRIPKPFEVGAIGTLAERTAEMFMVDEMTGDRFLSRLGHMMSSTFALNPIPQMVKPLLDVYANEESFTQRPIETMGMERLQAKDRYTGQTSEVAKWLGQIGLPEPGRLMAGQYQPLSPVQIDSLIRGYFSWLGVSATRIIDEGVRVVADRPARPAMQLRDVFFAGNFVEGLPANSSRYVTALYDQSKAIEEAYASYRFALRQGDTSRAQQLMSEEGDKIRLNPLVARAKQTMSKLNENIRAIERDMRLSPVEKRAQIDRIKALQNQIAMRISGSINQVSGS